MDRYRASGMHYRRIRENGKEIRQSLESADGAAAEGTSISLLWMALI